MKIDNSVKTTPAATPVGEGQTRAAKQSASQSPSTPGTDSVDLSPLSAQLKATIENLLASTDVVDAAKVEEIKRAISEGRFKINPGAVADKLLQSVEEMIRAYKR